MAYIYLICISMVGNTVKDMSDMANIKSIKRLVYQLERQSAITPIHSLCTKHLRKNECGIAQE